jgi:hypothetical protein
MQEIIEQEIETKDQQFDQNLNGITATHLFEGIINLLNRAQSIVNRSLQQEQPGEERSLVESLLRECLSEYDRRALSLLLRGLIGRARSSREQLIAATQRIIDEISNADGGELNAWLNTIKTLAFSRLRQGLLDDLNTLTQEFIEQMCTEAGRRVLQEVNERLRNFVQQKINERLSTAFADATLECLQGILQATASALIVIAIILLIIAWLSLLGVAIAPALEVALLILLGGSVVESATGIVGTPAAVGESLLLLFSLSRNY